jgi:hemerythrin
MASISWDESLSVHIPQIDEQHQHLVEMLDQLSDAMIQSRSQETLQEVLVGLVEYTHVHFATEEEYFARVRYPATPGHKAQHRIFIEHVTTFRSRMDQGMVGVSIDLLEFLADWLIKHIRDSDGAFGRFYAETMAASPIGTRP